MLEGSGLGTQADVQGRWQLLGLPPGGYVLIVSMVGYAPARTDRLLLAPGDTVRVQVPLVPSALELPAVVVTASKRALTVVDAPTSVSVITDADMAGHNATSLTQSLEYAPGVNMVSGQVNLRGSSGYSRGTGSRVLVLIDGFPALSADNGEVKWDAIPLDQVERVEIIKGAGSALYGTGALGGIINVITRQPSDRPTTRFRLLAGRYSKPTHSQWDWTSNGRYIQGLDVSHSRRIGRLGVIAGVGQKWTNGWKQNAWYRRYSAFGKLRADISPARRLTAVANWAQDDHGVFIQWKDRNEPLEVPVNSRSDETLSRKLNLNVEYQHLLNATTGCRVRSFVYRTSFDNRVGGSSGSTAHKLGQEVQVDLQPLDAVSLTAGIEWIHDRVDSSPSLFGNHTGLNLAAYVQAETRASDRVSLSLGGRVDRFRTDDRSGSVRLSPKAGAAWHAWPSATLRANLGWGFRGPSISEIYTNATFSAVPIVPNPDLRAEHSLSAEVGINQRAGNWGELDIAGFWSRYTDLVEARPNAAGVVSFRNVARGTLSGIEARAVATRAPLKAEVSYTYTDAVEDTPDGPLPLPYRPRHIGSGAVGLKAGPFTLETRLTCRSRIQRGSGLFPEGARDLIATYLLDHSCTVRWRKMDITLRVNNALAYNYAEVERNLGEPRRISLAVSGSY